MAIACRPRPNGNMPRAAIPRLATGGATRSASGLPIAPIAAANRISRIRCRSIRSKPILLGF